MNRLYIVEGPPCSGKSTVSRQMAGWLAKGGKKVIYVDEGGGDHPADYEFHAYVPEVEMSRLPQEVRARARECGEPGRGGWILPLAAFREAELAPLLPYKIYDGLPWETERPLMLDKWEAFAKGAEPDAVYVFNCVLLQNPMCETMMRFGFSQERSLAYISEITERIASLDPAVVYLKNEDLAQTVRNTEGERPGWLEAVVGYHVSGGYGKSIRAQGFPGYIACLEERQRRELAILSELPVRSIVIENAQRDWSEACGRIQRFLGQ